MGLFDAVRAAAAAASAHDLRVPQALEILEAYAGALERVKHEAGAVADANDLPYPKDTIKWAMLQLLEAIHDPAARENLKIGYISIAEWQDPADFDTGTFDSMRLRRKMDPLALARELAARATPENRRFEASRAEQAVLIEELKRRGFW